MKFVPEFIKSSPAVLAVWRAFKDPYLNPLGREIAANLPKWKRQFIVQVGTNDGKRDDPLFDLLKARFRWRAVLIEPIPHYFSQLVRNYGKSGRFMFEQAALGSYLGLLSFFYIDETARESPHWRDYFDRIGSLSRDVLIENLGDKVEYMTPYIVEENVNVLTMKALLAKSGVESIDALIVDAEGYDWEIVKQTFELGIRPKVILFEYTHLKSAEAQAVFSEVSAHYRIEKFERDCLCIRNR